MTYRDHGGECCGYKHFFRFDGMTIAEFDTELNNHFTLGNMNRVAEVILSERQVNASVENLRRQAICVREAGGWPVILAARGFIFTRRWRNSNSRNYCYQFLKTTEWASMQDQDLPFNYPSALKLVVPRSRNQGDGPLPVITPVAPPPPPPPPPQVTVTRSMYINNYANGTSSPWYPTRTRAEEAAPRCRIRQRVDIMSDGTIQFHTIEA